MLDSPGVYGVPRPASNISPQTESLNLRASQACVACRKQKRKCDKQLPSCSLCVRMNRPCDYSDSTPTPNADDFALLRQKVTDLESKLESRDTPWGRTNNIGGGRAYGSSPDKLSPCDQPSTFPPMFLLDSEIFRVILLFLRLKSTLVSQQRYHSFEYQYKQDIG